MRIFWALVILGLLLLHLPLIVKDPVLLSFDDPMLLDPLSKIHSFSDYFLVLKHRDIVDVQPIRDLSLWIDLNLKVLLPWGWSFHLTQVLLWVGVIFLVQRILKRFTSWSVLGAALFAFHPVYFESVAWISARKHLLSTFFILVATDLLTSIGSQVKFELTAELFWGLLLFYLLSCFSHPINVLWPIFAVSFLQYSHKGWYRSTRGNFLLLGWVSIAILTLVLNLHYYSSAEYHLRSRGLGNYAPVAATDLWIRLLVLGRSFFQVAVPFRPSVIPPVPVQTQNAVGLALFFMVVVWTFFRRRAYSWLWLLYFILPVLIFVIQPTHQFFSDTYVLNAGLGIFALVSLSVPRSEELGGKRKKLLGVFWVLVLSFFLIKSATLSRAWRSDLSLWKYHFENEPSSLSAVRYGLFLVNDGGAEEALRLALQVRDFNPEQPDLPLLMVTAVSKIPGWDITRKIDFLEKNSLQSPYYQVGLARLYAEAGDFVRATQRMRSAEKRLDVLILIFQNELESVVAEGFSFCLRAGEKKCDSLIVQPANYLIDHPQLRAQPWSDDDVLVEMKKRGIEFSKN